MTLSANHKDVVTGVAGFAFATPVISQLTDWDWPKVNITALDKLEA